MSADGSIELAWADGEDRFRLGLKEIRLLQEKTTYGPLHIRMRLRDGTAHIDEWRETIRLGLIGGGLAPDKAMEKVKRSVDPRAWSESIMLAVIIIETAMVGVLDDPVGKSEAEEAKSESSPMGDSPSPRSTEPEPPSDLPHNKLNP